MKVLSKENRLSLSEKTPYLKELAQRRVNCKSKIEEIKATLFVDKIFGNDVMFKRNYAVFSYNRPNLRKSEQHSLHFHIKPDLQVQLRSDTEVSEPYKYGKKDFKIDSFSKIYHIIPRTKSPLKRVGYSVINGKSNFKINSS